MSGLKGEQVAAEAVASLPPALDHEQVRALAQVGLMAARRCDVNTAEVIFAAIERSHPQRAMAYAGQVVARLAVGRLKAALQAADRGLCRVRPQDQAELHTLRGVVLLAEGRRRESEEALRQAGAHPLAQALAQDIAHGGAQAAASVAAAAWR